MPRMAALKPIKDLDYEQAWRELEKIVQSLETGQAPLDESMKLFERGQALLARCTSLLESARLKVEKLTGQGLTVPFDMDREEE